VQLHFISNYRYTTQPIVWSCGSVLAATINWHRDLFRGVDTAIANAAASIACVSDQPLLVAILATLVTPGFVLECAEFAVSVGLISSVYIMLLPALRQLPDRHRNARLYFVFGLCLCPFLAIGGFDLALPLRNFLISRQAPGPGTNHVVQTTYWFCFEANETLWLALYALFFVFLSSLCWQSRNVNPDASKCPRCSYDLAGIDASAHQRTCPECGKVFDPDEPLL
jgi:hypothetical protein